MYRKMKYARKANKNTWEKLVLMPTQKTSQGKSYHEKQKPLKHKILNPIEKGEKKELPTSKQTKKKRCTIEMLLNKWVGLLGA